MWSGLSWRSSKSCKTCKMCCYREKLKLIHVRRNQRRYSKSRFFFLLFVFADFRWFNSQLCCRDANLWCRPALKCLKTTVLLACYIKLNWVYKNSFSLENLCFLKDAICVQAVSDTWTHHGNWSKQPKTTTIIKTTRSINAQSRQLKSQTDRYINVPPVTCCKIVNKYLSFTWPVC